MGSDGGDLSCSGSGMVADGNFSAEEPQETLYRGQVQSLRLVSHILLRPEELPSHTKRHGDMITSLKSFLRLLCAKIPICYHAARPVRYRSRTLCCL